MADGTARTPVQIDRALRVEHQIGVSKTAVIDNGVGPVGKLVVGVRHIGDVNVTPDAQIEFTVGHFEPERLSVEGIFEKKLIVARTAIERTSVDLYTRRPVAENELVDVIGKREPAESDISGVFGVDRAV